MPLLDDHQEGDPPLTEAEATEAVRRAGLGFGKPSSVSKVLGLPNWLFTDKQSTAPDVKDSAVSRLCWELVYSYDKGEFETVTRILVDDYTGEVLGGDTTG